METNETVSSRIGEYRTKEDGPYYALFNAVQKVDSVAKTILQIAIDGGRACRVKLENGTETWAFTDEHESALYEIFSGAVANGYLALSKDSNSQNTTTAE
jgi:hypothetical protein